MSPEKFWSHHEELGTALVIPRHGRPPPSRLGSQSPTLGCLIFLFFESGPCFAAQAGLKPASQVLGLHQHAQLCLDFTMKCKTTLETPSVDGLLPKVRV
jgi:hypothetical protein